MKEWLKVFADAYDVYPLKLKYHKTSISFDQFITDFLHDNPLPLPTDEEIERVVNTYIYTRDQNVFRKGAKWMREQIGR